MRATLTFILLTALRDRLFPTLAILLALVGALALAGGRATIVEQHETAVVLAAGAMRLVMVLGLIVFIAFHIQRLIETREFEVLVSRPISRERLVLALFIGYSAVAAILIGAIGTVLLLVAPQTAGAGLFTVSLLLEGLIVCGLTLFAALTLERAVVSTLAAAGIYAFSRMGAVFLAIAASGRGTIGGETGQTALDGLITAVSLIIPRLDLFSQTVWLVHSPAAETLWPAMLLQAAIYLPLLLAATMFDLRRKRS